MSKNKTALLILSLVAALLVLAIFVDRDNPGYGDLKLPKRQTWIYVPLDRDCPLDYIRYGEGMCWDIYVPTPTPWSPPPGSTPWVLPTLTPTPPPSP